MWRFSSYGPVDPEEHFAVERHALVDRCVDQYRTESGQAVEPAVVDAVVNMTRGQPGLVSWFGELRACVPTSRQSR